MKRFPIVLLFLCAGLVARANLDAAQQAKLDACKPAVVALAALPEVVSAVVAQNEHPSDEALQLNNDDWKQRTLLDKFVRSLSKNPTAVALRAQAAPWVSEIFVNDAEGRKVAFLAKTTSWNHSSSAKHKEPMAGHTWQGPLEVDESSGAQQVQIAVPVLVDGQPVGSLVVGVRLSEI